MYPLVNNVAIENVNLWLIYLQKMVIFQFANLVYQSVSPLARLPQGVPKFTSQTTGNVTTTIKNELQQFQQYKIIIPVVVNFTIFFTSIQDYSQYKTRFY